MLHFFEMISLHISIILRKATEIVSARFWRLILNEVYQQARILVLTNIEVVGFYTLQIPKTMVKNSTNFPSIGRILVYMLSLVLVSNPMLIQYREPLVDIPKVATPKKSKTKSERMFELRFNKS